MSLYQKFDANFIIYLGFGFVILVNIFLPGYTNGFSLDPSIDLYELISNENSAVIYNDRISDPVFKKRIPFTKLQGFLNEVFKIPYQLSFNFLNLIFLVFCLDLLKKNFFLINQGYSKNLLFSSLLFLFYMPIIFAFSGYICSYDDFLQYFLILLLFNQYIKGNIISSIIIFFAALLVRETSLIFIYPLLVWNKKINISKRLLICVLPPIGLLFVFFFSSDSADSVSFLTTRRFFAWQSNFSNANRTIESVVCYFLILAFPIKVLIRYIRKNNRYKFLLILILINTVIVSITGLVKETRLLFLPLLLFFPLLGTFIEVSFKRKKFKLIEMAILVTICGFLLVFYHPTIGRSSIVYKIYSVLAILFSYFFSKFYSIDIIDENKTQAIKANIT